MEPTLPPQDKQSEPTPTPTARPGMLQRIIHSPTFTAVCGVATLIGTAFGFWGYVQSIREPKLTYYVSANRTPIVQKGKLDNFSVNFLGNLVTNDLSSVQIQIWNQGRQPIRREDILQPATIKTAHGEPLYQTTMTQNRTVIESKALPSENGVYALDWRILEKGDGINLQIIYGGNLTVPFIVTGIVAGQRDGIVQFTQEPDTKHKLMVTIGSLALGAASVVVWLVFLEQRKTRRLRREPMRKHQKLWSEVVLPIIAILFWFMCFNSATLVNYITGPTKPPFGF